MTQNLKLTPEQIQVIKLLEIPTVELRQRIDEELQANPMLEIGEEEQTDKPIAEENDYSQTDDCSDIYGSDEPGSDEPDSDDPYAQFEQEDKHSDPLQNDDFDYRQYVEDDELPEYRYQTNNYSADDEVMERPIVVGTTFLEYLREQIGMLHLTERQRQIAEYVIGNIDDRGYLDRTAEQLVDELVFKAGIEVADAEMEEVIGIIRQLDPPGVGAHDLQDCLLMQLQALLDACEGDTDIKLAYSFVGKNFTDIVKHHYEKLAKRYAVSMDDVNRALAVIAKLNPSPSNSVSGDVYETQRSHVLPDFRVEADENGELTVNLIDQDIPSLRVSKTYTDMMEELKNDGKNRKENKEAVRFIKERVDSANWFIDAIRQRNETLMKTMRAIVAFQRDYFLEGDDCFLKPMILEDISRVTGLDPSTISRVSNSKYVSTEFGVVPLKHFFSESLTNEQGEEVSTREVKRILRQAIEKEDKQHPVNDDKLVALLALDGYKIARRTVAKYREQLGIPVARLRRQV